MSLVNNRHSYEGIPSQSPFPSSLAPVLVRGGGKAPDQEILERTEALIAQGAAGIVYGRNVIQHDNPAGITRALMAIVHDGATAASAAKLLEKRS